MIAGGAGQELKEPTVDPPARRDYWVTVEEFDSGLVRLDGKRMFKTLEDLDVGAVNSLCRGGAEPSPCLPWSIYYSDSSVAALQKFQVCQTQDNIFNIQG